MRAFPRPTRVVVRTGNVIPDVSGEIDTRRRRARTETGMGAPVQPLQLADGTGATRTVTGTDRSTD